MDRIAVLKLLESNGSKSKAIRTGPGGNTKSLGIGLAELRKLARKIGRNHELAAELWNCEVYEARIMSLLIDDPTKMTRAQAEQLVDQLDEPVFAHVFSACGSSLAKTAFVVELAGDWINSKDEMRRRCGYGLLSEIATSRKKSGPDDAFFKQHIDRIHQRFKDNGKVEGGYALLCIGKRNARLNAAALRVARDIKAVGDQAGRDSELLDLIRHLTTDHLRKRLGL